MKLHEVTSLTARAHALLGDRPLVTLVDPNDAGTCLSVRLWRVGARWHGVVDDGAALLDRVRMGLVPGFVMHHDATPTLSGELELRIVGPASEHSVPGDHPFGLARAVVVEASPRGFALEPLEERPSVGALPRT